MNGFNQQDVINLLIKSQIQRTQQHLRHISPIRYVSPIRDYSSYRNEYASSKSPMRTDYKYSQPTDKRSPSFFRNKYSQYQTKQEHKPSLLMQLLQPIQPQLPSQISQQLQNSTIKEFQDYLSSQIYKHILLNKNQYKTQSNNHHINGILTPHNLSETDRSDHELKKSVCVMLNHYLQFLISIIEFLSNQINTSSQCSNLSTPVNINRQRTEQSDQKTPNQNSRNYFTNQDKYTQNDIIKPNDIYKPNDIIRTEPDMTTAEMITQDLSQLQKKAQKFAERGNHDENPLQFRSFGSNKKQTPEEPKDKDTKQPPQTFRQQYEDHKYDKTDVESSAGAHANEFLILIFEQGNQRANRIVKEKQNENQQFENPLQLNLSGQSKINKQSIVSFGTDLQNDAFLQSDSEEQFDLKLENRINIPSDEEDDNDY